MSALKVGPLATGVVPLRLVGVPAMPVAVRVQAEVRAVPPLSLVTVLSRVREGALSLLVMVQVAIWPAVRVTEPLAAQAPLIVPE